MQKVKKMTITKPSGEVNEAPVLVIPGEGGSVSIDATLSKAGQAADAKATGDAISNLSTEITNVKNSLDGVQGAADRLAEVLGIV